MSIKIACLFSLYVLAVSAQTDRATNSSAANNTAGIPKVTPKNVSDLYIGDLLRTKPKDVLEASASAHHASVTNRAFLPQIHSNSRPVETRSFNYKAHGGHEYAETEFVHPIPESKKKVVIAARRIGPSARSAPVLGHLVTLKPVRVLTKDDLPLARNSGAYQKTSHYANDDCSKSGDHSHSSEEKPYVHEERSYPRAKQFASSSEYRSPQSSEEEDDRSEDGYSSHSGPSSGSYDSKTHPSDTNSKSHSSGSYTQSKSSSTSRTVNPNRSKQRSRIVPTTVAYTDKYERDATPAHKDKGDFVVYKVKEPPTRALSKYSENTGDEYSPPSYESNQKTAVDDSRYSQYQSDVTKPQKYLNKVKSYPSNPTPESERPQQYGPASYEQDHDSYGQDSYTPTGEQRYRDQPKLSNYHKKEQDYTSRPVLRGHDLQQTQYQSYHGPETAQQYDAEPKKPLLRKRQRRPPYDRVPNNGGEDLRHRDRQPRTHTNNYANERYLQSSRPIKESPRGSYESYVPQTKSSSSVAYEGNQPTLRPSEEKELRPYVYEPTPHDSDSSQNPRSHKRHYRESARSARSPGRYIKLANVEARQLAAKENQPIILVSRESKPYISHSVSYSKSGYNAEDPKTESQPDSNPKTEGRQSTGFDVEYPTAYKPYNSEYPASYANDPQHASPGQYPSQTFNRPQPFQRQNTYEDTPSKYQPYEGQQSYDQSGQQPFDQSGQQPYGQSGQQSYDQSGQQPYDQREQQPYDQSDHQDESYEDEAPAKKNKDHNYISKVEGYRDEYQSSVPLHLDDAFFEKYGISKNAKIIVAHEMKPNLLVADGTKIQEGGGQEDENSGPNDEERYQPNFKEEYKDDSYNESPEQLGAPKEIPGSFDDLVNTNPKFLRKLPYIMDPVDSFFKNEGSEDSFDENEFKNVEQKGFIMTQGPREIVQQHGDGVSRILFNVPQKEGRSAAPSEEDYGKENRRNDETILSAAATILENIITQDS